MVSRGVPRPASETVERDDDDVRRSDRDPGPTIRRVPPPRTSLPSSPFFFLPRKVARAVRIIKNIACNDNKRRMTRHSGVFAEGDAGTDTRRAGSGAILAPFLSNTPIWPSDVV
ncbi:hypothetical protein K523DRAFT_358964 [Schizophyllum commune Tattone D]|nr:hypothetical protein K523DRAFT_358964 [Schizophyllum commune Tattone D]